MILNYLWSYLWWHDGYDGECKRKPCNLLTIFEWLQLRYSFIAITTDLSGKHNIIYIKYRIACTAETYFRAATTTTLPSIPPALVWAVSARTTAANNPANNWWIFSRNTIKFPRCRSSLASKLFTWLPPNWDWRTTTWCGRDRFPTPWRAGWEMLFRRGVLIGRYWIISLNGWWRLARRGRWISIRWGGGTGAEGTGTAGVEGAEGTAVGTVEIIGVIIGAVEMCLSTGITATPPTSLEMAAVEEDIAVEGITMEGIAVEVEVEGTATTTYSEGTTITAVEITTAAYLAAGEAATAVEIYFKEAIAAETTTSSATITTTTVQTTTYLATETTTVPTTSSVTITTTITFSATTTIPVTYSATTTTEEIPTIYSPATPPRLPPSAPKWYTPWKWCSTRTATSCKKYRNSSTPPKTKVLPTTNTSSPILPRPSIIWIREIAAYRRPRSFWKIGGGRRKRKKLLLWKSVRREAVWAAVGRWEGGKGSREWAECIKMAVKA